MRLAYVSILACAALAASSGLALAQAPQKISFQARLTDTPTGVAIGGTHSLTFRLWSTAAVPVNLWTETQPAVPITSGLFTVLLGSVVALPALAWDSTYTVGISVDAGSELTPRYTLASSPYSLDNKWTVRAGTPTKVRLAGAMGDFTYFAGAITEGTGLYLHLPSAATSKTGIDASAASSGSSSTVTGLYSQGSYTGPDNFGYTNGVSGIANSAIQDARGGYFLSNITGAAGGFAYGVDAGAFSSGTDQVAGYHARASTSGAGTVAGDADTVSSSGNGNVYGFFTKASSSGTGLVAGLNEDVSTSNATGNAYGTNISVTTPAGSTGDARGIHAQATAGGNGVAYGGRFIATGNGTALVRGIFTSASNATGSGTVGGAHLTASSGGTGGVNGAWGQADYTGTTPSGPSGPYTNGVVGVANSTLEAATGGSFTATLSGGAVAKGVSGSANYTGTDNPSYIYGVYGVATSPQEDAWGGYFASNITGTGGASYNSIGVEASATSASPTDVVEGVYAHGLKTNSGKVYGGIFSANRSTSNIVLADTSFGIYAFANATAPAVAVAAKFDGDVIVNGRLFVTPGDTSGTATMFGALPFVQTTQTTISGLAFTSPTGHAIIDVDLDLLAMHIASGDYVDVRLFDGASSVGFGYTYKPIVAGVDQSVHAHWTFKKNTAAATTYSIQAAKSGTGADGLTAIGGIGWNQMNWTFHAMP